jgi:glycosyltransferase involved in cell wall biosynthesis
MPNPVILDPRVVTGSGGGPDKTLLNSPRFLEPLGYRMICAYLHPPNDPGFEVIRKNAERYGAPLASIPDRGPKDLRVVKSLIDLCRREKVAVWHGHDYKTNALGLLVKRFHRMRLVTTVHGWVQHTKKTPLYYRIDKFCLKRYEKVICVSDDLIEECSRVGVPKDRLMFLENGIDADDYRRRQSISEAKAKLGLPAECFLIGAVGRLSDEKGFDVLIRAVKQLAGGSAGASPSHGVHLAIVGEGGERAALEKLIAELNLTDRVTLAGWQGDVRGWFEAMDAFALSSHREGLPNVLLEAMALEVPLVATRVNGVPRLVQHEENGLLVEAGDANGLAAALSRVMNDAALRDRLRAAGRATVEGRYSFRTRMEKLAALYDGMSLRS